MKRIIIFSLILISVLSSLSAISNTFTIYLNKKGTDEIWFSDSDSADGSQVSNYMFPIINATENTTQDAEGNTIKVTTIDMTLESSLYLHWSHQSSTKDVKITLSFVGDKDEDASTTEGYMMNSAKGSDSRGLNYDVKFEDANKTVLTNILSDITFGNSEKEGTTTDSSGNVYSDVVSKAGSDKRVRSFKADDVVSPLKITMTLVAPKYKSSSDSTFNQAWMENQYVGYIKATITQI